LIAGGDLQAPAELDSNFPCLVLRLDQQKFSSCYGRYLQGVFRYRDTTIEIVRQDLGIRADRRSDQEKFAKDIKSTPPRQRYSTIKTFAPSRHRVAGE
jgi:hypothetical protein